MRVLRTFGLLLLLVVATSTTARAADWSLLGGDTLGVMDGGLRIGVGWPDFHVAYHAPITEDFEVAPKLGFVYGTPSVRGCCFFGNSLSAEMRYEFYTDGDLHLALRPEVGVGLVYTPGFAFDIRLGLGVAGSYAVSQKVNVLFSFDVPVDVVVHPAVYASIPILFGGGVEFIPKGNFMLWSDIRMGPDILAASGGSVVTFGLIGQAGVGFKF